MTQSKKESFDALWMLGAATMLPLILLSGPLAGYVVGEYFCVRFLSLPKIVVPILAVLGIAGSAIQTYKLIKSIKKHDSQ